MTDLIKKRNSYYRMVWQYEKRRRLLREKYGLDPDKRPSKSPCKEYTRSAERHERKLRSWRREVRRMDALRDRIVFLEKSVRSFMGIDLHGNSAHDRKLGIAQGIYYKYGLESGISGLNLLQHIGGKYEENASRGRIRFTKSFAIHPENKELWLKFKAFHQRKLDALSRKNVNLKQAA